jgi:hypothetical protein
VSLHLWSCSRHRIAEPEALLVCCHVQDVWIGSWRWSQTPIFMLDYWLSVGLRRPSKHPVMAPSPALKTHTQYMYPCTHHNLTCFHGAGHDCRAPKRGQYVFRPTRGVVSQTCFTFGSSSMQGETLLERACACRVWPCGMGLGSTGIACPAFEVPSCCSLAPFSRTIPSCS